MEKVGIFEVKANLSHLIERVIAGEEITISRRGVPVALLSPIENKSKKKKTLQSLKKFRDNHNTNGISIKELITEGRKY
ncbi:MAG: type II toxin-antitoxin system prevent-host-death family antitoxin [Rickettsiales bacterium]